MHPGFGQGAVPEPGDWGRNPQPPEAKGVWGRSPQSQPQTNFCSFYIKKTLILAPFFIVKGHAVSAVTIDNAKMFSQLMSKSRSLAKISERRLRPLLV